MFHRKIARRSAGALLLRFSCALALGTAAATVAAPVMAAPAIPDSRLETAAGASAQLRQAVGQYRSEDPHARFRWLHGHVDSFTTRPRDSVPDYAKPILAKYGMSATPNAADPESTTLSPHKPRLPVRSSEESSDIGGGGGGDDSGEGRPGTGSSPEQVTVVPTKYYSQANGNVATEILAAFLRENAGVFELGPELTNGGLPNLQLIKYGDGRHFRRAHYEQSVNGVPLLNAKTVVLFDLNWNVIVVSRQLATAAKLSLGAGSPAARDTATTLALQAVRNRFDGVSALQVSKAQLGIDPVRNRRIWEVDVQDNQTSDDYAVTLDAVTREVLNVSDNTARFTDAQVSRWRYPDGDMKAAVQQDESGIYTHDDNTLVHDFFYMMNDDRNDGGTGACTSTAIASNSTPNAYGTTTSAEYIRPTRRGDRNFTLWNPNAPKGSFGESHVYFWAREYMQWQKQALVDLGVLTLGSFNNFTKALIIVNSCNTGAGRFDGTFLVSTLDDAGEGLGTIRLPEVCRSGNPNCTATDYDSGKSYDQYTYEGNGGYHFPGVIHHELNHFVLIDYFGVTNRTDCAARNETRYFQEGGLGRNMPQLFWHNWYGVGYLPDSEDKLFQSDDESGRVHDETDAGTLNELNAYACGADSNQPYFWGGVVAQPLWEIYHGQKIVGAVRSGMGRPAQDLGMIKSNYYAADLASASTPADRFEFANRFMEFWELFSTAQPVTKTNWCDTWGHHGLNTFIDVSYCN